MTDLRAELERAREQREALGRALLGWIDDARAPYEFLVAGEAAEKPETGDADEER